MADGGSFTKPQRLNSSTTAPNKKNPSKFYNHFLFKAVIFTIFVVITLFVPSEPPDFVSPSAFFAKSWELVHLILVGIAVSYGLFSRRNDEGDGGDPSNVKSDVTAQSYMSRLLQVTSVFDDEVFDNNPSGSHDLDGDDDDNVNKMQTWSAQYRRNEPMLVVTDKKSSVIDQNTGVVGADKPLLLPVRSLRSRVFDEINDELDGGNGVEGNYGGSRVYNRSNTSPRVKGVSNNSRSMSRGDGGGLVIGEDYGIGVGKGHNRSNSSPNGKGFSSDSRGMRRIGSMKPRGGESNGDSEVLRSVSRSKDFSSSSRRHSNGDYGELDGGFSNGSSEVTRSLSRTNSNLSSRGFPSISRKRSSGDYGEMECGELDDSHEKVEEVPVLPSPIPWRTRSGRMEVKGESDDSTSHSLPPSLEESEAARSLKHQSSFSSRTASSPSPPKELSPPPAVSSPRKQHPSTATSPEPQARSAEDVGRKKSIYSSQLPRPPPPPPPPHLSVNKTRLVKSYSSRDEEEASSSHKVFKRSVRSEPKEVSWGSTDEFFSSTNVGSQAKARNGVDSAVTGRSVRTVRGSETRTKEVEATETEMPERKSSNYNPMSVSTYSEYPQETRDFLEQVLLESDDESESDSENHVVERVEETKVEEAPSDVDKKADEFIAKFREQIRLQRIESIKKSAGQLKRTSVR